MIKVFVKKQGNFPVSTVKIKKELSDFFIKQGISSDADVDVAIVGENQMLKIGRNYLSKKEPLHNVLSFVNSDMKEKFLNPPDNILHLGNIVLCYPVTVKEANDEGVLVEKKVIELLVHGAYHLLGIHHE